MLADHRPGLAPCRRRPLSLHVRRQPNPAFVLAREPPPIQPPWRFECIGARTLRRASAAVAVLSGCAVHSGGSHWRSTARAGLIRALRVVTCILLGTFCTPRSPGASSSARRLTPRSSGAPTAYHQRPAVGTQYIFATRAWRATVVSRLAHTLGPTKLLSSCLLANM